MGINFSSSLSQTNWQPTYTKNTFTKTQKSQDTPYEITSRNLGPQPTEPQAENSGESKATSSQDQGRSAQKPSQPSGLTEEELKLVEQLKKADQEVRSHEMAHVAAGGQYVTSGARLQYRKGPDGIDYAVAGEVSIDTSAIPGDPKATAAKMRTVQRAALAPISPSPQDRKVAAQAGTEAAKATAELMMMQAKTRTSTVATSAQENQNSSGAAYAGTQDMSTAKGRYLDIMI